jgi:hypothetical protein
MEVRTLHRRGPDGSHMIMMADTDKDGRISQAEAVAGALKSFDDTDTNRDGTVTGEERQVAMRKWVDRMRDWTGKAHAGEPLVPPPAPPRPLG